MITSRMLGFVRRGRRSKMVALIASIPLLLLGVAPAWAVPTLQLYIEGATYDSADETWVTTDGSFRLWVIGDVGIKKGVPGPPILGVHLAAAVAAGEAGTITLTPATTTLVMNPSTPGAPTFLGTSADGAVPHMSDGDALPTHGVYGAGTSFLEWALGDFTLTDSPIGDFITAFPSSFPSSGEIKVYDVVVTGFTAVHFDAYDGVEGATHATFAPFSHDAGSGGGDGGGGGGEVSWPPSLALLLGGALGLSAVARRYRRR